MHEWANIYTPLPYAMLFKDVTARLEHQPLACKVSLTQGQVQAAIADIFVGTLSCPRYFVDVRRRAAHLEACAAAGLGVQNPSEDMVAVAVFRVLEEVHGRTQVGYDAATIANVEWMCAAANSSQYLREGAASFVEHLNERLRLDGGMPTLALRYPMPCFPAGTKRQVVDALQVTRPDEEVMVCLECPRGEDSAPSFSHFT